MNIIDIAIVILLAFGALLGFKRGFTKQLVNAVGFILIVVIAFYLKNSVSEILYQNLPFFSFGGIFKGVTVLNILLYEFIAFVLVLSILSILLKILMLATSIFEKVLNMTIILGIPSKMLGAVIGVVQYFVIGFVALYVLSLPIFDNEMIRESKMREPILSKTPILSGVLDKTTNVIEEFVVLKDKYATEDNANQFNLEALDVLLKYNVVDVKAIDKLDSKGKLSIDKIETILQKYR